ncbi:uncharacterized protein LOC104422872 [Eucalyptus grandis]|uniref:Uncharacterized protein n=1 Tax=Eucalyptus globulus TaxID=34317 RepID=A0ABD3IZZ2_EUCGL|nr:uncharacterized protein LOC104422872 [Eucalyptus grandis]XP_010033626.2 uncharacterized protein LOC104422872 [Eucalyptus grandis]
MTVTVVSSCNPCLVRHPGRQNQWYAKTFLGAGQNIQNLIFTTRYQVQHDYQEKKLTRVFAVTEGSTESSKSEETLPSWAKPDADEPPPWARNEGAQNASQQSFEVPFFVYLLASAVTAIAAVGSIFEYVNQRPVFGVLNSDSIFYAPLLGFFAFTGIPTSAFLWFKSVQVANKEAEEQDRRDGFL